MLVFGILRRFGGHLIGIGRSLRICGHPKVSDTMGQ